MFGGRPRIRPIWLKSCREYIGRGCDPSIKWVVPEFKDVLIQRLGGLHTIMYFIKVITEDNTTFGIAACQGR
jgi:hypothetical protein